MFKKIAKSLGYKTKKKLRIEDAHWLHGFWPEIKLKDEIYGI